VLLVFRICFHDYTTMSELAHIAAWQMAAGIRDGSFTASEVLTAHLAQIRQWNPGLNAFVSIDEGRARVQAAAADDAVKHGRPLPALHGVPITIKSSIDVAGLLCEAGTQIRRGYTPPADAPLVSRLKAAGAIVLGNTTVPEFLMAWETHSELYGRTNSPWDPGRTPGGSSGGEAAAIAACCSAAGIGSDGGGSIRVPAHFTGICGLKPTPGRIPATGHFPSSVGPFASLGVVGPMARTVRDLQLVFEAIAGPDNGDTNAAPVPLREFDPATLFQLRIGCFEDDGRTPVTTETRRAIGRAAESLRNAGFTVEPFRPEGLEEARQLWRILFINGAAMLLRQAYRDREGDMYSIVREILAADSEDPPLTAERLLHTLFARDMLRHRFFDQMDRYPILLCPVNAVPAFRHGERSWMVGGRRVDYLDASSYSQWFNLLGNPAVVLTVDRSDDGLPIGVQIVGKPWHEEQVLAVAAVLEQRVRRNGAPAFPLPSAMTH
jgi:Asp-tRNA(Asn)/Glu-tRNA(Gln) amidotransferase A subunit family amidase